MPWIQTKHAGEVSYTEDSVLTFPSGLPGFETCHNFIVLHRPNTEPLVFMQSVDRRELCFILLPILVIDRNYKLDMSPEELEEIGLPAHRKPEIGVDIFCGALVCAGFGTTPSANLLAPVVVNLGNRMGIQVIQSASGYSHQQPLLMESASCS